MKRSKTLSSIGEWGLLSRLLPRLPGAGDKRFLVGPGDDAAVFRAGPGTAAWVFTTDMLVEGVHFDLRWTSAEDLGWKALAVNLSDLAAMGGVRPAFGVVSMGLPPSLPARFVDDLYRGLSALCRRTGFSLAGGDTVRAAQVTLSIAALGELPKGRRPLTRDGAKPGDILMTTGTLGDAAAGLMILQRKGRARTAAEKFLTRRLLRPMPRLDLSAPIAAVPGVTAMMDASDGLWRSAWWIARASGAGARVEMDRLPLSPALKAWAKDRRQAEEKALSGGEDYELVLTARPAAARRLEARGWARPVGRIEADHGVRVYSHGQPRSVPHGFEHF